MRIMQALRRLARRCLCACGWHRYDFAPTGLAWITIGKYIPPKCVTCGKLRPRR